MKPYLSGFVPISWQQVHCVEIQIFFCWNICEFGLKHLSLPLIHATISGFAYVILLVDSQANTWMVSHAGPRSCCYSAHFQGGYRVECRNHYIQERRLLCDASSMSSKLRTLGHSMVDDATVDVLGMCLYTFLLQCQANLWACIMPANEEL